MNGTVIERLGRMISHLAVIRFRSAIKQQLGQFGMMSDAGCAIERTFPFWLGLVILFEEARIGVGARIEQSRGRLQKALGARPLKPQKLGEAEMRQRIPIA